MFVKPSIVKCSHYADNRITEYKTCVKVRFRGVYTYIVYRQTKRWHTNSAKIPQVLNKCYTFGENTKRQKSTGACSYMVLCWLLSFRLTMVSYAFEIQLASFYSFYRRRFKLSSYCNFLGVTAIFVQEWSVLISINMWQATRVVNDLWEAPNCLDANGSGRNGYELEPVESKFSTSCSTS